MGEKQLINRKIYKEIKRYDRQEMENFLANIYNQGYQDGVKDGDNADFKIKLVEVLKKTKGVGPKTFDNIMKTVKELEV